MSTMTASYSPVRRSPRASCPLAVVSKHLCPSLLAEELAKLERTAEGYVTHLKPGEIELTMQEIEDCAGQYRPRMLQNNQIFEF